MLWKPDWRKPEGGLRVEQIAEEHWNTGFMGTRVWAFIVDALVLRFLGFPTETWMGYLNIHERP